MWPLLGHSHSGGEGLERNAAASAWEQPAMETAHYCTDWNRNLSILFLTRCYHSLLRQYSLKSKGESLIYFKYCELLMMRKIFFNLNFLKYKLFM